MSGLHRLRFYAALLLWIVLVFDSNLLWEDSFEPCIQYLKSSLKCAIPAYRRKWEDSHHSDSCDFYFHVSEKLFVGDDSSDGAVHDAQSMAHLSVRRSVKRRSFLSVDAATVAPTSEPSSQPSAQPTSMPSGGPTAQPSTMPTSTPTTQPTSTPSLVPTAQPTFEVIAPTAQPTMQPSAPTSQPTSAPSVPTSQPTSQPTIPTSQPTSAPSPAPTGVPTNKFNYPNYTFAIIMGSLLIVGFLAGIGAFDGPPQ